MELIIFVSVDSKNEELEFFLHVFGSQLSLEIFL